MDSSQPPVGTVAARTLRVEWAARSLDAAWAFPSDWNSPAVDAVCEAVIADGDAFPAAERLGRLRAGAGVSLGETLADIDQLVGLVPAKYADGLRRAVSLGWADRAAGTADQVCDPLTGLVSREYLDQRLTEIYQAAAASQEDVAESHALVVVRMNLASPQVWQRVLPMILAGECLRVVFDAGETLARLGEPMAVVLVRRSPVLNRRVQLATTLIRTRVAADPDSAISRPRVWIEPLPTDHQSARWLLAELGR